MTAAANKIMHRESSARALNIPSSVASFYRDAGAVAANWQDERLARQKHEASESVAEGL
jgi:hypothetical protein